MALHRGGGARTKESRRIGHDSPDLPLRPPDPAGEAAAGAWKMLVVQPAGIAAPAMISGGTAHPRILMEICPNYGRADPEVGSRCLKPKVCALAPPTVAVSEWAFRDLILGSST